MSDFRKYLDEQLKDEEFKKEWEDSECEYDLVALEEMKCGMMLHLSGSDHSIQM